MKKIFISVSTMISTMIVTHFIVRVIDRIKHPEELHKEYEMMRANKHDTGTEN